MVTRIPKEAIRRGLEQGKSEQRAPRRVDRPRQIGPHPGFGDVARVGLAAEIDKRQGPRVRGLDDLPRLARLLDDPHTQGFGFRHDLSAGPARTAPGRSIRRSRHTRRYCRRDSTDRAAAQTRYPAGRPTAEAYPPRERSPCRSAASGPNCSCGATPNPGACSQHNDPDHSNRAITKRIARASALKQHSTTSSRSSLKLVVYRARPHRFPSPYKHLGTGPVHMLALLSNTDERVAGSIKFRCEDLIDQFA